MFPWTAMGIEGPCHSAVNSPSAEARIGTLYFLSAAGSSWRSSKDIQDSASISRKSWG